MPNFLKRYRFRISIGFILVVLLLVILSQLEERRRENWFSHLVQTVSHPFLSLSNSVYTGSKDLWLGYLWLVDVRSENLRLKTELRSLKEEVARNQEIITAFERQRKLLEFAETNDDDKVFAEVIGEVQRGFSRLLVLNKGAQAGIKKNFAVVTPEGVVGKIQSVTPYQSVVQLVTDPNSQFPVLIQRTRSKAMIQGSLDGDLTITNFPRRQVLDKGDLVITSGLAGILPKGFSVGRVSRVEKKEFGLFQTITLNSTVDLNKLEEVAVILFSRSNIHQPLFSE
ncbi:MAG: rod shape-determining protein MreC [bacterium]|nr:rod shape-determining protein MreC [bacterium]